VLYVVVLVPPIRFHTKLRLFVASPHHHNSHSPLLVLYSASTQHILASAHTTVHATPLCCAAHHSKLDKILPLYVPADFVDHKRTIRSISILHSVTVSGTTTTIHTTPDSTIHSSVCWTLHRPRHAPTFRLNIHSLDCCAQTF
jgi:hypothetical protein